MVVRETRKASIRGVHRNAGMLSISGQCLPSSGGRGSAAAGVADARRVHPIERLEVAARVAEDFGVAGMVGALHRDDALAERCVFLLQEIRKLLLGLGRSDDQDLMRAREGRCHFLEELRIGRMFMPAVRALAAM